MILDFEKVCERYLKRGWKITRSSKYTLTAVLIFDKSVKIKVSALKQKQRNDKFLINALVKEISLLNKQTSGHTHLYRFVTLPVEDVLPLIGENNLQRSVGGYQVSVSTNRLRTYKERGVTCMHCGLKGFYFAVETHGGSSPHLNLYAIKAGKSILMTSDHIHPKSKGGSNSVENLQPLCQPCNGRKGDKLEEVV